jgi:hypothetical protein
MVKMMEKQMVLRMVGMMEMKLAQMMEIQFWLVFRMGLKLDDLMDMWMEYSWEEVRVMMMVAMMDWWKGWRMARKMVE